MITKEAENSVFRFIIYLLFIMQRELMLQTPSSSPAVYLYFSARARATAARNLSIDTWTSGVKASGNVMAMTTRMLWERICENKYHTHVTWMWILTPNPLLCVVRSGSTTLHVGSTLRSGYLKETVFIQSSYNNKQTPQSQVLRMNYRFKLCTLKLAGSTSQGEGVQLTEVQKTCFQVVQRGTQLTQLHSWRSFRASSPGQSRGSGPSSGRSKSWSAGTRSASWV